MRKKVITLSLAALLGAGGLVAHHHKQAEIQRRLQELQEHTINNLPAGYRNHSTYTAEGIESLFRQQPCEEKYRYNIERGVELGLGDSTLNSNIISKTYQKHCTPHLNELRDILEAYHLEQQTQKTIPSAWDEQTKQILKIFEDYTRKGGNTDNLRNKKDFEELQKLLADYDIVNDGGLKDSLGILASKHKSWLPQSWVTDDGAYINTLKSMQEYFIRYEICEQDRPIRGPLARADNCKRVLDKLENTYKLLNQLRKKLGKPVIELSTSYLLEDTPHGASHYIWRGGQPNESPFHHSEFSRIEITPELLKK